MKKLTVVFYEYPKALHDIKAWEELKQNEIQEKYQQTDSKFIYELEKEIVYCTPLLFFDKLDIGLRRVFYYKTLIFGKFNSDELLKISQITSEYEKTKIKPAIIHLDGIDKSGKDTVRKQLVNDSKGNYLVYVRSFLSQIAYSRIYNRNIDEEYFFEKIRKEYEIGAKFFLLFCSEDVFRKRYIQHNETDLDIDDFKKHSRVFIDVCAEISEKCGITIMPISTEESLEKVITNIKELL